jgi:nucleoside-diphosphate-sugar epimerase
MHGGMGPEYTADNSRLLAEMGGCQFWDLRRAINDLYSWYERQQSTLDIDALRFDEKIKIGANT